MTRHINGFRPLREGERWHRDDWNPADLPPGWRPMLHGELYRQWQERRDHVNSWYTHTHSGNITVNWNDQFFLRTQLPIP